MDKILILRITSLLLSGLLTAIMMNFVPVAGGGSSLIFVLSIPIILGISIVFSIVAYFLWRKNKSIFVQNIYFCFGLLLILFLTFTLYPYKG